MSDKKIAKHLIDVCKATERPPFPIGIIVSDGELSNIPNYIEVRKDAPLRCRMPILVVGKEKAESVFRGKKLRMLDKTVAPRDWINRETFGQYWTFSPTERYSDYSRDVCEFIGRCLFEYYNFITPYFTEQQVKEDPSVIEDWWSDVADIYGY